MNHIDNYNRLRNTLSIIETKGNNTLVMADCLKFLEQCINECKENETEQQPKGGDEK